MSTRSHRKSISSSSSTTTRRPSSVIENSVRKITVSKPQFTKKRPAFTDITNQKDGSQLGSRVLGIQSKSIVPCSVKIAKKKESSAHAYDKSPPGKTLTVEAGPRVPSKEIVSRRSDNATLTSSDSSVLALRNVDVSPSTSFCDSAPLDESMSTCDSLKSPEFEYIDNEDDSAVSFIERRTYSTLNISDHAQRAGKICKRDLLVGMESTDNFVDIDDNVNDPQFCAAIACDIYKHMRASEAKKRPSIDFIERIQKDMNASMRAILIDWLVEVAEEYRFAPETLFLTVNYIDRYLSGNMINRQRLQLLGVACMMIAAKYEEICAPQVEEFCYVTDNTYSKEEVLQMESAVLNYLKFEMTAPTTKCFLRRFVCAAQASNEVPSMHLECLANYIGELSLLEYSMLSYAPSLIAASATFLANFIIFPSKKPWNSTLGHYTVYQPSDLCNCVKALHHLFCNGGHSNLRAIREKYSQHKYKYVAKKFCSSSVPPEFFEDPSV